MSSTKVRWDPLISPALPLSGASQVVQRERSGLQCRNCSFDPWVRRSPGEGNGNTLQYSCLENPMDRGAWQGTVHRAAESQRGLRTHLILFQAALSCYCGFSPGSWLWSSLLSLGLFLQVCILAGSYITCAYIRFRVGWRDASGLSCGHALARSPTSAWPKSGVLLCSPESKVASCQSAALCASLCHQHAFLFNLLGTWQRGMAAQKQNGVKDSVH